MEIKARPTGHAAACAIVRKLRNSGHQAYFVGGYVRDLILDRLHEASEIDLVTSATVAEVGSLFSKCQFQGARFGVVQVACQGQWFDVATLRIESGYTDSRHPDLVQATSSLSQDVQRRDFTINGLYYDPLTDEIIDQVGAIEDLAVQRLRAIGVAQHRMTEDALRILRAIRFATHLNFELDPPLAQAVRQQAVALIQISRERIVAELNKIFNASVAIAYKKRALHLLIDFRIWQILFETSAPLRWEHAPLEHALNFWMLVVLSRPANVDTAAWARKWRLDRETIRAIQGRWTILQWLQDPSLVAWSQLRLFWAQTLEEPCLVSDVQRLALWLQLDRQLFDRIAKDPLRVARAVNYDLVTAQEILDLDVAKGPAIGKILAEIHRRYLMFEIEAEELSPQMIRQIYETLS